MFATNADIWRLWPQWVTPPVPLWVKDGLRVGRFLGSFVFMIPKWRLLYWKLRGITPDICSQCGTYKVSWQYLPVLGEYRYYCRECPNTWITKTESGPI